MSWNQRSPLALQMNGAYCSVPATLVGGTDGQVQLLSWRSHHFGPWIRIQREMCLSSILECPLRVKRKNDLSKSNHDLSKFVTAFKEPENNEFRERNRHEEETVWNKPLRSSPSWVSSTLWLDLSTSHSMRHVDSILKVHKSFWLESWVFCGFINY